jgi:spermidine synthase
VVLVGLGAGVSLGATASYDLDRLVCVELSPEVVRACRLFDGVNGRCLDDPRLEMVVNDGRHFLATTDDRFDVINVDPIDPPVCTLYSRDFFQVCHDRLAPGGLMVQWVPVFRMSPGNIQVIMRSFLDVFPESTVWYNGTAVLMVGSRGRPLQIHLDRFLSRGRDPRVERSLAMVGSPDPWLLLSMFVGDGAVVGRLFADDVPENTDDRPYLEYTVLRTRERAQEKWVLGMLPRLAGPLEPHLAPEGMVPGYGTDFQRTRRVANAFFQARVLLLEGRRAEAEALLGQVRAGMHVTPRELEALSSYFGLGGG